MKKIKVFCFPYAGGSAMVYNEWNHYLDPIFELRPVELAGRGRRINDTFYTSIAEAIEDVFAILKSELDEGPYLLYGHSMGSKIAYGICLKIQEHNLNRPLHVFCSGSGAPHIVREDQQKFHLLNDEDFAKEIMDLGGTPAGFFEHPELVKLFLPVLKNDFRLVETISYPEQVVPIESELTVLLGKDDDLTPEQCEAWRLYSNQNCQIQYFDGGHFFIHDHVETITRMMGDVVSLAR